MKGNPSATISSSKVLTGDFTFEIGMEMEEGRPRWRSRISPPVLLTMDGDKGEASPLVLSPSPLMGERERNQSSRHRRTDGRRGEDTGGEGPVAAARVLRSGGGGR